MSRITKQYAVKSTKIHFPPACFLQKVILDKDVLQKSGPGFFEKQEAERLF